MNEIEAIEQLKFDKELAKRDYISPTNHEEFDLAISALEKQLNNGWISVSQNLPKAIDIISDDYRDNYLACDSRGQMFVCQRLIIFGREHWNYNCTALDGIVAWQPLPEKYTEVSE